MTHKDHATEHVTLWIMNDGDYYDTALALARELSWPKPDTNELRDFLVSVLESATVQSAPWHVRQDTSNNELANIDWYYVAEMLLVE